jgi:predicted esterase
MRAPFTTLMAASLVAIAACSETVPTGIGPSAASPLASTGVVTEPASGPWARIVEGETGPGSLYAIYVPRQPNGDAVFYAHGIRDAYTYLNGVGIPTQVHIGDQDGFFALRDILGSLGYTVAYSSFSENGFAVKDGSQRTHQLRGLVAEELRGQPTRSFIVGHSLGGAIGLDLVERFPSQYDGALLMCGMVGGSMVETQYVGHVRALFDAFYPGHSLGGSLLVSPRRSFTPQEVAAIVTTHRTGPAGMLAIASIAQTPLPFDGDSPAMFQHLIGSLFGALSFHARGVENILDLTKDQPPFDNLTTVYSAGTPARTLLSPDALTALLGQANAGVERVSIGPRAETYVDKYFTPTGQIRVPVITLHNTWDPGVPEFHEEALAQVVAQAGASNNLLRRKIDRFGHCAIMPTEAAQSFRDLAEWVSTGVRPAN